MMERDEELAEDNGQDLHRCMPYHDQMPDTNYTANKINPSIEERALIQTPFDAHVPGPIRLFVFVILV